ncbi:MAG: DUF1134 domain-containing protein [Rhodospirillales bacterium CG15_BIG_FIL_POST_REV_8_21_14_020_66_15]|nr:MAG: DUF1134 domain-containing protein [Rhodospirillales bacterium CG15_BIG_FIL_POST_REV_8_21_14_020_66_15]
MRLIPALFACVLAAAVIAAPPARADDTYSQDEILAKAKGFFGSTTKGLAEAIQKVFEDKGKPNAIILGEEASGAIGVGLRYGEGMLERKSGATQKVYWQGPSIGFDLGGNASKVFTLVYNLGQTEALYQRYPGVDGSFYVVAGLGVNYQQAGDVILAPIRTGVGLRAGASIGYLHYSKKHSWIPF